MSPSTGQSLAQLRPLLEHALELTGAAQEMFVQSLDDQKTRDAIRAMLVQQQHLGSQTSPSAVDLAVPLLSRTVEQEEALDRSRVGECIGSYRLVRLLAVGGMGTVYLAERATERFSQEVALKVVSGTVRSASARERFERERQVLAGLKHPSIALLFDGGQTPDGESFYTMEYVDGQIITDFCRHLDSVKDRLLLLLQVAGALAYAHQNLIVHRDIKPSNVLVTTDGQIKVVDFGVAKLLDSRIGPTVTHAGGGPMTPVYAAPEQFSCGAITVATDIYQFGVLCFVVLTGRLPYRADPNNNLEWVRAVAEQEPISLTQAASLPSTEEYPPAPAKIRRQLTRDLDAIVRKALSKAPSERYASMDSMMADFDRLLAGRPVAARRAGPIYFAWRFAQRWRYAVASTLVAFVALIVATTVAINQSRNAVTEADRANAVASFLVNLFKTSDPDVNGGRQPTAHEMLDRGTRDISNDFVTQPLQKARIQTTIGDVYTAMGDYKSADLILQEARATLQTMQQTAPPSELGHALRSLAWVKRELGHSEESLALLDSALSEFRKQDGRSSDVATTLRYRAAALTGVGKVVEARKDLETALDIFKQNGLESDVLAKHAEFDLGILSIEEGNLESAQSLLEKARDFYEHRFGPAHPQTLLASRQLANVLMDLNRISEARTILDAIGPHIESVYGARSLKFAAYLNSVGEANRLSHRSADAIKSYEQAREIFVAAGGALHPGVGVMLSNKGQAYLESGDFDSALKSFGDSLAIRKQIFGTNHLQYAMSLDGRSQALIALGRFSEALEDATAALQIRQGSLPTNHPRLVRSFLHVGQAMYGLGDRTGADRVWAQALSRGRIAYAKRPDLYANIVAAIREPALSLTHPVSTGSYD